MTGFDTGMDERPGSALDWMFRNRRTGRLTVAQVPNVPLVVCLAAVAALVAFRPGGRVATALVVTAWGALVVWAVDEIVRGVNPWRRILGGGVLAVVAVGTVVRLAT